MNPQDSEPEKGPARPEEREPAETGFLPPVYDSRKCPECSAMYTGKNPRTGRCADRRGCQDRARRAEEARNRPRTNGNGEK